MSNIYLVYLILLKYNVRKEILFQEKHQINETLYFKESEIQLLNMKILNLDQQIKV